MPEHVHLLLLSATLSRGTPSVPNLLAMAKDLVLAPMLAHKLSLEAMP